MLESGKCKKERWRIIFLDIIRTALFFSVYDQEECHMKKKTLYQHAGELVIQILWELMAGVETEQNHFQ